MKHFGMNDWTTPLDIGEDLFQTNLTHYYKWLYKLSTTVFEWKNLPDSVSERYLEMVCQSYGKVLFCKPDNLNSKVGSTENFIVVQATESNLNVYGRGQRYNVATPVPIEPSEYNIDNSVMLYNDDFGDSIITPLSIYADRLAKIQQVKDVNRNQLMTPTIIPMEEKQRLSWNNLIKKVHGGALTIFTGKSLDIEKMKSLDLGAKFYLDKLQEDQMKEWNEALTFISIQNNNNPKKERNIVDEINSNNVQTDLSGDIRFKTRKDFCKRVNEMFNLNIDVCYRRETIELADKLTKQMEQEAV